ncbi:hypothetical protein GCM10009691_09690 [Brevibacterium picturae]
MAPAAETAVAVPVAAETAAVAPAVAETAADRRASAVTERRSSQMSAGWDDHCDRTPRAHSSEALSLKDGWCSEQGFSASVGNDIDCWSASAQNDRLSVRVQARPDDSSDSRADRDSRRIMTKWEYVTVPLIVHATKQILDQWGEDGYELVQVVPGPDNNGLVAYLKRPKD